MVNKNKKNKENAQITEEVQEEIINDAEESGAIAETKTGNTYTLEEFNALPKTARRENGNSIYKMVNEKFETNKIYMLTEVYKYLQEISKAKNNYKTLWVAYYAKNVRNINKIGFDVRTVTATGEQLIQFEEKTE